MFCISMDPLKIIEGAYTLLIENGKRFDFERILVVCEMTNETRTCGLIKSPMRSIRGTHVDANLSTAIPNSNEDCLLYTSDAADEL